jgi:hypothetical protein
MDGNDKRRERAEQGEQVSHCAAPFALFFCFDKSILEKIATLRH